MFEPVIGLEVHVQLDTKTKAFCSCATQFAAPANINTCPVCLGLPGSLPVLNKKIFEYAIKTALALNCGVNLTTKFDRKNYFYPDLPKNYQISQYDLPLAENGVIEVEGTMIRIKRVHIEEDAGKLIHEKEFSLVDFNRTGTPLLEIVTEPDIYSAKQAQDYLKELKSILEYLEVSTCDMEKGFLRCDANVSLRPKGEVSLGVKAEVKNMNSFKAVRLALEYEIERQLILLREGGKVIQETRLWDEKSQSTSSMRSKEEAHDYRYFPDPDLPLFTIEKTVIDELRKTLPELPKVKCKRFKIEFSLSEYDAAIIVSSLGLANYFEECIKLLKKPKMIANWLIGSVAEELNKRCLDFKQILIKPKDLVDLIKLVESNTINNLTAKQVLTVMFDTNRSASEIIKEKNLAQISDESSLREVAQDAISSNKKSVDDFKSGKQNALMFLVGQVMKATKGKANPKLVRTILENLIKEIK
ncbi:MAG: Asp-tRNA(Asn)/Glu-tRNA(Gln) amidotransferase subunit GatB [Candidatus Gygaella obscura]|nr:Asp-tRNA(Asn)/Glu-tRNA(Gln) amidotransferase subunit GatB [Candidatus Gygaella obscura]